jgi:hypothetical protein
MLRVVKTGKLKLLKLITMTVKYFTCPIVFIILYEVKMLRFEHMEKVKLTNTPITQEDKNNGFDITPGLISRINEGRTISRIEAWGKEVCVVDLYSPPTSPSVPTPSWLGEDGYHSRLTVLTKCVIKLTKEERIDNDYYI